MPSLASHLGSGDTGSESGNEQKKFSVPLASVAKSTQKLHVSNIPPNMEESGLRYIFGQFGEISSIYLKNMNQNGPIRGGTTWAFVTFDNPLAASIAMEKVNMTNTFGLQVKLAMSEQEKSVKRMTEHEKEVLILEQQQRLEAFERTQGIGHQNYPVDQILGPMEGKAVLLKECAKAKSQPMPAASFQRHERNAEISDFSPYETAQQDMKIRNNLNYSVDESKLKPFVLNGRTLPCLAPVPVADRCVCSYPPCEIIGLLRCARCKAWYCSQRCQINDWQIHKANCEAPPPLEKPDGTPYRPPSQNLRLSNSTAAFCNATSRMSPQQHNATMPEVRIKPESNPSDHNATISLPNHCSNALKTKEPKENNVKGLKDVNIKEPEEVNAKESKKNISIHNKAKVEPQSKSATVEKVQLDQPVYKKTILDTVKIGDIIQIIASLEEPKSDNIQGKFLTPSPASFSATCFQDQDRDLPVLDYVLGTLQDESRIKQLSPMNQMTAEQQNAFQEGKIVIAFDGAENAYSRYIYLHPDLKEKKAILVNIDSPKELPNIPFSKIFPAEEEAYRQPSLGFQFKAIGKMTQNEEKRIIQMAIKESFDAKVLYVKTLKDGRLKHMTVSILNSDGNAIMTYKVEPYYMNKRVADFMQIETSQLAELKGVMPAVNDQVHGIWDANVKFGQWSDLLMVMRIKDIDTRKEMQKLLQKSCNNAPPINVDCNTEVQGMRGSLVACKYSNDGQYYRAILTGTKPDKVRVCFVDFGNTEVEDWKNIVELPDFAKNMELYPKFVNSIHLDDMPKAVEFGKDLKLKSKLSQLQPLFDSPLQIKSIRDRNGHAITSCKDEDVKYVLVHPNGKTIQDIIQDKLNEKEEEASKGDIQGGTIEGLYDYNKCHFAEIKFDPTEKSSKNLEQDVIVLNAESPTDIFVCPTNQIGLAENLQDQVRNYAAAVGDNYLGAAPIPNHLCIAKSVDDEQWYRAVCCKQLGDDMYELMYVDYGNIEIIPRKNIMHMAEEIMKTPLLASHCVLEGFEDQSKSELYKKAFGDKIQELLPMFEDVKLIVVKKIQNTATYVVQVPKIANSINISLLANDGKKSSDKPTGKQEPIVENDIRNECDAEVDKILSSTTKSTDGTNCQDKNSQVSTASSKKDASIVLAKDISRVSVKPGNSVVALGFTEYSNNIYVQRVDDAEKVEEVGNVLKTKCSNKPFRDAPVVGQMVACKWSDDNELYRAEILEVLDGKKSKVYFVDYGNTEIELLDNVMQLPQELVAIPFLASIITLEGVEALGKSGDPVLRDLLQEMEAKLLEEILEVDSVANDKYVLKNENGDVVNATISNELKKQVQKETSFGNKKQLKDKLEKDADIIFAKDIPRVSVNPGDSVVALGFVEYSNTLCVQRVEDADKVEEVGNILKTKCSTKAFRDVPIVGQMLACKWSDDNELYRAEVLEVLEGKKIKVYFVDYGNTEIEGLDNVMLIPQEAVAIPFLASLITLQGVAVYGKPGNPTLCDLLQEMEDKLLEDILEVVSVTDEKYVLKHENGNIFNDTVSNELEKEGKKEITSDENKKELKDKLEKEATLRKAEEDKRKELEDQIRKMQEMLSQMSK